MVKIQWRQLMAVNSPLMSVRFIVEDTIAAVTSWNDVFPLEAEPRVDEKDANDNWPIGVVSIESEENSVTSCFKNPLNWFVFPIKIITVSSSFVKPYSKILVKSLLDFTMVSTWEKEKRTLLSQLSEFNIDFMIGQNNHGAQSESGTNTIKHYFVQYKQPSAD